MKKHLVSLDGLKQHYPLVMEDRVLPLHHSNSNSPKKQ